MQHNITSQQISKQITIYNVKSKTVDIASDGNEYCQRRSSSNKSLMYTVPKKTLNNQLLKTGNALYDNKGHKRMALAP